MEAAYDFSGGVRGKNLAQHRRGTNVVVIEPELTRVFPDSKSVKLTMRLARSLKLQLGPHHVSGHERNTLIAALSG